MNKGKILIGWHRDSITPPWKVLLQGQFHRRFSDKLISPITATALAIDVDGQGHVLFLSCDLAYECFKTELLEALRGRCPGLDLDMLTVNATHVHTGLTLESGFYEEPQDDPDFCGPLEVRNWLVGRLVEIVETAWNAREPGLISRGYSHAVVGRCRRAVYEDGSALMYGDTSREDFSGIEACDDHNVNMLYTHDTDGNLTGALVNLACPAQVDEHEHAISADFWHEVRVGLAERYGEKMHLLPQCAPAGDVSPHLLVDKHEEEDLRERTGMNVKQLIARRILVAIDEGLATSSQPEAEIEFEHRAELIRIPRQRVTEEEYELEKRIPHMSEAERAQQSYAFRAIWPFGEICDLVGRYENQGERPMHDVESHFIRIGDIVIATNPFELFLDYGFRIRARSKARQTFLVQLANGTGFYLPTERALDGGHYSAMIKSIWCGPEGGKRFVEESVTHINAMFGSDQVGTG